ncbi:unnamed protein product [Pieris macdunnoughi]|uniref:Seminal fluid protein HACP030 n=1 Tax=Pieris macdunnoughi TaxID=345717 RepID=A0A821MYR3_9NEOP|nr:unnamed protein product [Pieris macdunnoughi]
MSFTFCILTYLLLSVNALYNKDVICIIEKGVPICETIKPKNENPNLPSHEPLLPNIKNGKLYNCTSGICEPVNFYSLTQLSDPLKFCYQQSNEYKCQKLKYNNYKNVDKVLFLSNNIAGKKFYLIDCLVYSEGARVCHKKDESHAKLIDTGNIVRPKEANILSQEEFICEEGERVVCDFNRFVPYGDVLKHKDQIKIDSVVLKTGTMLVNLQYDCIDNWCGFVSTPTRRMDRYEPPGGKVYRCYYAKRQQVCKELYSKMRPVYNERDWLSS